MEVISGEGLGEGVCCFTLKEFVHVQINGN